MSSLTKKAYARGIGEALQRMGQVQFANEHLLKEAADFSAQYLDVDPASNLVPDQSCLKVAQQIYHYDAQLKRRGKVASYPQGVSIAHDGASAFGDLLHKVAEEVLQSEGASTAVGIEDHSNDLAAAGLVSELGAKELAERPVGYANVGQGNANFSEPADARVGMEQDHPLQPTDAPGENSVTEASKVASARFAGQQAMDQALQDLLQVFG